MVIVVDRISNLIPLIYDFQVQMNRQVCNHWTIVHLGRLNMKLHNDQHNCIFECGFCVHLNDHHHHHGRSRRRRRHHHHHHHHYHHSQYMTNPYNGGVAIVLVMFTMWISIAHPFNEFSLIWSWQSVNNDSTLLDTGKYDSLPIMILCRHCVGTDCESYMKSIWPNLFWFDMPIAWL